MRAVRLQEHGSEDALTLLKEVRHLIKVYRALAALRVARSCLCLRYGTTKFSLE